jgi:membrane protein
MRSICYRNLNEKQIRVRYEGIRFINTRQAIHPQCRYCILITMYILTRKFWTDFIQEPREALSELSHQKSRFWYPFFNFIIFWRVVFSEYSLNHCITRASAIAFVLLLTMIPLITTVALIFTSITDIDPSQVTRVLSLFLPFAPPTVLEYIGLFFTNAQKLRGIGIFVLIIVTVGLFGLFEESLNHIWKVTRSRSFFARLRTFTMVMVYSPVLFLTSFQFRRSLLVGSIPDLFAFDFLPFFLVVLAFTTLIWFVPNTKVRFGPALLGGLCAAVLFEIERQGFGYYVRFSMQTQTIYGAFGILPLFLVSLFFSAIFILFGAQIAYVYKNYRPLLRAKKRWDRRVGDYRTYITFRMMLDAVYAFRANKSPPTLAFYTRRYELTEAQALGILKWLMHAGFLHNVNNRNSFVPTRNYLDVPVRIVLDEIEDQNRRIPPAPDDFTKIFMKTVMERLKTGRGPQLDELTFDSMIEQLENGERRASRVAVIM